MCTVIGSRGLTSYDRLLRVHELIRGIALRAVAVPRVSHLYTPRLTVAGVDLESFS